MATLSRKTGPVSSSLLPVVLGLACLVAMVLGMMVARGASWNADLHPALNAMLNASSALLLVLGFRAIQKGLRDVHRQYMISAFVCSSLFLASYLTRYAISGTHRYPGSGLDKTFYLALLFSHMILAIVVVPMIFRALFLAHKGRFSEHKKLAKWTWRLWMYVSVTGVMVYVMLYQIAA